MPRPKNWYPTLKFESNGHSYARFGGRKHRFGHQDDPETFRKFADAVQEWIKAGRPHVESTPIPEPKPIHEREMTIGELAIKYRHFCRGYYVKDGKVTREAELCFEASKVVVKQCHDQPVSAFTPKRFKAVRLSLIQAGNSRKFINKQMSRIRRMFKWGVEEEYVSQVTYDALTSVADLKQGRCDAHDLDEVQPVEDSVINATLKILPPVLADMVRIQRLTGMRPGEVCAMRVDEIDRNPPPRFEGLWIYRPSSYKTQHTKSKSHDERIFLGEAAQAILRPYIARRANAFIFSPQEVMQEFRRKRNANRKTQVRYGNGPGDNRKDNPEIEPGERYSTGSYRMAIQRRIDRENRIRQEEGIELLERWSPNQIRHTAATEVRELFGLDGAQVHLRHVRADVTQVYAEKNQNLQARIARQIG